MRAKTFSDCKTETDANWTTIEGCPIGVLRSEDEDEGTVEWCLAHTDTGEPTNGNQYESHDNLEDALRRAWDLSAEENEVVR